ncbi:unnamed protein product [Urochloa humidicola]
MNKRLFMNLVVDTYRTGMLSLRRINLVNHLFYQSTAAAEAAMARSEAAIRANARRQAGYKHGLRSTRLGALPAARINVQPSGLLDNLRRPLSLDFVTLRFSSDEFLHSKAQHESFTSRTWFLIYSH